ncbi:MAG: HAD-IC family P-type ATPase [Candidatus Diapherotrites archaeon]|nr:HAD-IC family P-type ATPase [Candidatus Diapherotrites archaeon]
MNAVREPWHSLETQQVFEKTKSTETGLTSAVAQNRLLESGPNEIAQGKKFSAVKLFADQFRGMLVTALIIAGALSFIIQDYLEGIAIYAILLINAALGFVQEYKAEKSLEALKKMTALKATVIRGGRPAEVDCREIVPGDVVLLHTGDKVPADLRLVEAVNLKIDEAILTGESKAVSKTTFAVAVGSPVAERHCIAFANTTVTYGRGKGIVVGTGMKTEFGKIANYLKEIKEEETPLKKKLEKLGQYMVKVVTGIIVLLFVIGVVEGTDAHEMFKTAISLGVAAIPEGLPAVITITLALGVFQMAKKNALTKKMHAVEALGATTIICSDKTGTLTRNEMVVEKIFAGAKMFDVTGNGYEPAGDFLLDGRKISAGDYTELSMLLKIGAECNDADLLGGSGNFSISGDPTEGCLVVAARKAGVERKEKRVDEIPFESERKMMTTFHEANGKIFSYSKGAVEKMVELSDRIMLDGKISVFLPGAKKEVLEKAEEMAMDSYRVLGFAFKEKPLKEDAERGMVFAGFVCMNDPVRKGVSDAIQVATQAGIKIKIITGDNALTACAVAKKIGLEPSAITGAELDALPVDGQKRAIVEKNVFARVSPEHKLKIVSVLKERGEEIVAVTGDGVNDAPALKKADIGIAMGIKGTDVSKEAADLILKDDDFATIVTAIREGRRIYNNIKSFVKYLLAANTGEVLIVGLPIILNFFILIVSAVGHGARIDIPLPLLPLQLLWLNIVTDSLPALALGSEESRQEEMQKKPRNPKEGILDNTKSFILIAGIVSTIVVSAAFFYGLSHDMAVSPDLDLNSKQGLDFASKARTMAFTALVVFELLFVFSCRRENRGVFDESPLTNPFLVKMVLASFALQALAIYLPPMLGLNVFNTVPLGATDWAVIFALSSTSFFIPYIDNYAKKIFNRKSAISTLG